MLRIKPLLSSYDMLNLGTFFSITDAEQGVADVQVSDRFGLPILEKACNKEACQYIYLQPEPRGRFPLFVKATSGSGETIDFGPVFPAPTDPQFGALPTATRLPAEAVDVVNDPEIRRLRSAVRRGDAAAREIEGSRQRNSELHRDQASTIQTLSTAAAVFTAAALVVASQESQPFYLVLAGLAATVFAFGAAMALRRQGKLSGSLQKVVEKNAAILAERHEAVERLIALGLPGLARGDEKPCGCGPTGASAETTPATPRQVSPVITEEQIPA